MTGSSASPEASLRGDLPQHPADGPLQRAHARLAGVLGGQPVQGLVGQRHVGRVKTGPLQLPGQQVPAGDRHLLGLGVAVQRDRLHPVHERLRDRLGHVGGRDEQHVGQVQLDLEVVVAERVVLRRVQHLEQRGRRVAAVVRAELVDLVQQDHRVHGARLADRAHDPAGQRADVGPAVTADLGLVADATQRHPRELAAHGPRHRLTQRGLADPGRSGQRQHRAAAAAADQGQALVGPALAHGQVLDDPVLDVIQAGVVRVQDGPGRADVVGVVGRGVPRDLQHRVQPGADPAALGRLVGAALQLVGLLERRLLDLLGQVRGLDPGLVVVFLGARLAVQLRQLLADGRELLAQQELALLLLHALAHVVLDGLGHVQLGQRVAGPADQPLQALLGVDGLQQLVALLELEVRGVARAVGQRRRLGDVLQHVDDLPRAALLQDRRGDAAVLTGQLLGALARGRLVHDRALDPQRRAGSHGPGADLHPGQPADHRGGLAAGQPAGLLDHAERADRGVLAADPGHQQQLGLGVAGPGSRHPSCLYGRADLGVINLHRDHHGGQHDGVVERQHRQGEGLAHQVTSLVRAYLITPL